MTEKLRTGGDVEIPLPPQVFSDVETPLATMGDICVSGFRYGSGIAAVRMRGPRSEVIVLPFFGHQVWRARFDGVDVTMRSMFDEPVLTEHYLETYGAFFVHCGLRGLGDPGPTDKHRLHGELPLAPFSDARLRLSPAVGRAELCGTYRHRVAFSVNYRATARVAIRSDAAEADISMDVANQSAAPMDLLYLGHANFRPVDHGTLVYSAPYTPQAVAVRRSIPSHITPPPGYADLIARLAADPTLAHRLDPAMPFDPEAVFTLAMQADAEGWGHAMQVHPDGTADFISYDSATLPMATRWICRTADQQGLGIAMPSTSGVEGYAIEKAAGRVTVVAGHGHWGARMRVGRLDAAAAAAMARRIDSIAGRG